MQQKIIDCMIWSPDALCRNVRPLVRGADQQRGQQAGLPLDAQQTYGPTKPNLMKNPSIAKALKLVSTRTDQSVHRGLGICGQQGGAVRGNQLLRVGATGGDHGERLGW